MPQMAPMSWFYISISTHMLIILLIAKLYFTPLPFKPNLPVKFFFSSNWKW